MSSDAAAASMSLVVGGTSVDLNQPVLMGIVNATPDSFSDGGLHPTTEARVAHAIDLAEQGAAILDVGGQSGITGVAEVPVDEEIARIVPVIDGIRNERPQMLISVDTYRPDVVRAALDAGAAIINDTSGLLYPKVADLCGVAGAGLVVMHNRARPKQKLLDPALYGGSDEEVVNDVVDVLASRLGQAITRGVAPNATIVDPGPDFAKTPHQTVMVLRSIDRVRALGRPILLALSRKDFIGAIIGKPPRDRLAGTLAAIGHMLGIPGTIVRVHDVDVAADYLRVAEVLAGRAEIPRDMVLREDLRRQAP